VKAILGEHVTVQISKRNELHTLNVMSMRWIVERSFAWLDKNRRLWKNCERKLNIRLQFIHQRISGADSQKIINRLLLVFTPV